MSAPDVFVAVVVRPGADPARCLAALQAAGADDPHVVRVRDWVGGFSDARNRALDRCRAEVLALVEDDVVVGPGWLDAVRGTFDGPDAALRACAGGPIAASENGRPAWLGEGAIQGLALMPLDGPERDLTPEEHTFPGGNVAFRAAALRGVGGFWPARGHRLSRDWFGEDHHAQHELAAAGWTARFVPAMAAERLVDPDLRRRDVLAARLRYGSRYTLVGGRRTRQEAAVTALKAAAGTGVAIARRDPALAIDRASRAAENAGVLLGPLVAHADLQPVARRTPFRDSVPRPAPHPLAAAARPRLPGSAGGPRAAILLYHRVADVPHDPQRLAVGPEHFAAQLEVLGDRVVPLEAIADGSAPDGAIAITFDDGYVDNLEHAAPLLQGRPATLFVTTGATVSQKPFWWDVVSASHPTRVADRAWPPGSPTAAAHLAAFLLAKPPEVIAELTKDLDGVPDGRAMTVAELEQAARTFTLGAHTRTHRSLAWADADVQREELTGSAGDLEAWTGRRPTTCSYPFGVPGSDVDQTTMRVAREAGFAAGVVNTPGLVTPKTDRFALPRFFVDDLDGDAFAAWLDEQLAAAR